MRTRTFIAAVLPLLALLPACAEEPSPLGEDGRLTIALIGKSAANPVFVSARRGAEDAARELSERLDVPIDIVWLTPPTEDAAAQAERIAQAVRSGVDAVLISASDAAALTDPVNAAVDSGVPVMTFDSDIPDSRRFSFYGADDADLGRQIADRLATALGGQGTVAILAGNPDAPNLQARVRGIQDELAKHPGITVAGVHHHAETPADAAAEVLRVSRGGGIDGWAMVGGWPLFEPGLLSQLDPARVRVVAVDALPGQLGYVESGLAPVLLAQPTYRWGYVGVQSIADRLLTDKAVPEMIPMQPVPVIRENLGYWARQLREWGFEGVDEKYLAM